MHCPNSAWTLGLGGSCGRPLWCLSALAIIRSCLIKNQVTLCSPALIGAGSILAFGVRVPRHLERGGTLQCGWDLTHFLGGSTGFEVRALYLLGRCSTT
jgi:hypothetical protein